jgi:hypothetical protein
MHYPIKSALPIRGPDTPDTSCEGHTIGRCCQMAASWKQPTDDPVPAFAAATPPTESLFC